MKYLHLIFFLLSLGHSFAQDAVDQLTKKYIDQAQKGLIQLHTRHRGELTKIQNAAMELKDLELANKANAKIKELDDDIRRLGGTPTEPNSVPADAEFEGTTWAFHNKGGKLGEIELLAGGKIKSQQYPKASWKRIDKNTLRYQYGDMILTIMYYFVSKMIRGLGCKAINQSLEHRGISTNSNNKIKRTRRYIQRRAASHCKFGLPSPPWMS